MTAKQHFTQYWTGWANSPNELRGNETEDELIERSHIEFAKFHVLKIKHLQQNKYYSGETGYIKSEEWKDIINNIK